MCFVPPTRPASFPGRKHQLIRHGGIILRVAKTVELPVIEPEHVGLARLEFHRNDACPLVGQIVNLAGRFRESLLGNLANRPHPIRLHVFAEGDSDFLERRAHRCVAGLRHGFQHRRRHGFDRDHLVGLGRCHAREEELSGCDSDQCFHVRFELRNISCVWIFCVHLVEELVDVVNGEPLFIVTAKFRGPLVQPLHSVEFIKHCRLA